MGNTAACFMNRWSYLLTFVAPKGIGVTLNPMGDQNGPTKQRLYELAQMFLMIDLFF